MAELRTGSYNFNQLESQQQPSIVGIQAEVGRQLNERYYRNRQAYITQVANPIANMQVRTQDRELYNSIRDEITEEGNAFKASNDWSQADNYVFSATENIMTNEALKAMQMSFAQEQQYKTDLKASGWDSRMQSAFMLRSQLQSEAIQWDKDTNTVMGGGWSGVETGAPIDISKKYKQISDIVSKVKASGQEVSTISSTDALAQGLATSLNMDGQTFVSNFLKSTYATEGVSYETIANYAKSVLEADPEYQGYLRTVGENEAFLKMYDPTSKTVRDWTPNDVKDVYKDSYTLLALAGQGLNLSDIGTIKSDGTINLNPNMSAETRDGLTALSLALGFDFTRVLQGQTANLGYDELQALNQYLEQGFNNYFNDAGSKYLNSLGIKESDNETAQVYLNNWYQQQYIQNFVNDTINSFSDSTGKLLSYQKTKTLYDLVSNQTAYAAAYKQKQKQKEANLEAGAPTLASMPDKIATRESTSEILDRRRELGNVVASARNDNMGIVFKEDELDIFGLNTVDDLKGFNLDAWLAMNPISDASHAAEVALKIRQYQRNNTIIQSIENELQYDDMNLARLAKAYQEDNNLLWNWMPETRAGIRANAAGRYIVEQGITNYADWQANEEYIAELRRYSPSELNESEKADLKRYEKFERTARLNLNEDSFNEFAKRAYGNIAERYAAKHPETPLTYATKGDIVFNPSKSTQQFMNNGIASIATGNGDWSLETTSTGKLSNVALNTPELAALFTVSGTQKSGNPLTKFEGIDGKPLGIKGKIFNVQWNPVFDPSTTATEGIKRFKMQATFLGAAGEYLGDAIVGRNVSEQTYSQLLQDNYTQGYKYQVDNPDVIGDNIFRESAGKISAQVAQSVYSFKAKPYVNSTTFAANVNSLQEKLQSIPIDRPVYVDMDLIAPVNGLSTGIMQLEITRVGMDMGGTQGYKVRAVSEDGNGNWIDASTLNLGGQYIQIPTLSDNADPVSSISEALLPLANVFLELGANIQIANGQR